ncbi:MAG: hypothetical protein ACFFBP_12015 [Promethearchaeota archaeon]
MSIHGEQNLLPFLIRKDGSLPELGENEELCLAYFLLNRNKKSSEKLISFSRLLWPFLTVPGVISTHIIIDGLLLFQKIGRFSNWPRQPLIGHVLRNIDNKTEIEQLNKIIEILTYKDAEAKELSTGEESEYQDLKIEGIINPEFLQSLLLLMRGIRYKPIKEYMPLNATLNTDQALDISEHFRTTIETMKSNGYRWKTIYDLIDDTIEKLLTNVNVKLSDIKDRYNSQIKKVESSIENTQAKKKKYDEFDKSDQWRINEKKKVIENISTLFKTIERSLEDILKTNKFYVREESLKSKIFEELLPKFKAHFNYLREQGQIFLDSLDSFEIKYNEFEKKAIEIDAQAEKDLKNYEDSIQSQLDDNEKQRIKFEKEKLDEISGLENLKIQIEDLKAQIIQIVQNKQQQCYKESEELKKWSVDDSKSEFFSMPIKWIYMPVYAMFFEDEEMMEERMSVIFPGFLGDKNVLYEEISEDFKQLRENLLEKIEEDMKLRSIFEFSSENKNLLNDVNLQKKIMMGISALRYKNLLTDEVESEMRENLKSLI